MTLCCYFLFLKIDWGMPRIAIVYLIWKEMNFCFGTVMTERVHVNATSPTGLDVEFDISLPQVPCSILNIDANDPSGQTQSLHLDRRHHIWKHRLKRDEKNPNEFHFIGDRRKLEQGSTFLHEEHLEEHLDELEEKLPIFEDDDTHFGEDGSPCGSCFGAGDEGECCDTCDDVKRAYKRKGWHLQDPKSVKQCQEEMKEKINDKDEGCNVHGLVALDSGGGSFHLAPGKDHSMTDMSDMSAIFDLLFRYVRTHDNQQGVTSPCPISGLLTLPSHSFHFLAFLISLTMTTYLPPRSPAHSNNSMSHTRCTRSGLVLTFPETPTNSTERAV